MIIRSKKHFEAIIGYDISKIEEILCNIDQYYYSYYDTKKRSDGNIKKRLIHPSKGKLKDLQKRVNDKILKKIPLSEEIMGGIKSKSNLDNAKKHQGNKFFFQTDLSACFPSIDAEMVKRSLRSKGIPRNISILISRIVTYPVIDSIRQNSLPQGNPTSTMVANIVLEKVILKVKEIIKDQPITFTIWIDDWTFSSLNDFQHLTQEILSIIAHSGFKIARKKTTYRKGNSIITGVVVTANSIKVTNEFRAKDQTEGRKNYKNQVYLKNNSKIFV